MTELPALREAVRVAAERRYGRRRLRLENVGAVLVAAAGVALLALIIAPALAGDDREVAVTATPRSGDEVEVLDLASARDDRILREGIATGGRRQRLVRAWSVPALGGTAYLMRSPRLWCLSVPVPGGDPDTNRAGGCESPRRYRRIGIALTFGTSERGRRDMSFVTVVPRGARAPLVTDASGGRERLRLVGGLGVVGRVPRGTVIVNADGTRVRPGEPPLRVPTPQPQDAGDRGGPALPAPTPAPRDAGDRPAAPAPTPTPRDAGGRAAPPVATPVPRDAGDRAAGPAPTPRPAPTPTPVP